MQLNGDQNIHLLSLITNNVKKTSRSSCKPVTNLRSEDRYKSKRCNASKEEIQFRRHGFYLEYKRRVNDPVVVELTEELNHAGPSLVQLRIVHFHAHPNESR